MEASLQQNWNNGSGKAGERSSNGSMMIQKPWRYVANRVAKSPKRRSGLKSDTSVTFSLAKQEMAINYSKHMANDTT